MVTSSAIFRPFYLFAGLFLIAFLTVGCAHYPVNQPLEKYEPDRRYRGDIGLPGNSESTRYNFETGALLRESFNRWTEEVRSQRCPAGKISTEPNSCGDIKFYLVEVKLPAPAYRRQASRQDGTGTAGPFDRALGPEHVEGLPGKVISFYIVPLDPAYLPTGRQARRGLRDTFRSNLTNCMTRWNARILKSCQPHFV